MALHELANEQKTRARVGQHILSEMGKGKVIKLSSESFGGLKKKRQD
jgi:hypothetical protein